MDRFFIGVDLGQANDFTAVCVLKAQEPEVVETHESAEAFSTPSWNPYHRRGRPPEQRTFRLPDGSTSDQDQPLLYVIGRLDRWRGIPYHETNERIAAIVRKVPDPALIVDRTGVGRPVYDALQEAGLHPIGVTVHGGDKVTHEGNEYSVPKRDLIGAAQMALGSKRLKIAAKLTHAATLEKEVLAYRYKMTASGQDTYGSWRESDHDDLLFAASLAVWYADRSTGGKAFAKTLSLNFGRTVSNPSNWGLI